MPRHLLSRGIAAFAGLLLVGAGQLPGAQTTNAMNMHTATGGFDVKLTPISPADAAVGAMSIAKTFHGDLDATSTGQMLAVRTGVQGSAGYVAMEHVTGTLGGKHGSFSLQHSGTMTRGTPSLSVTVVPDSGTDGLAGIAGSMEIIIEGGQHHYRFRYTLPE
jgi:hypothetical protein